MYNEEYFDAHYASKLSNIVSHAKYVVPWLFEMLLRGTKYIIRLNNATQIVSDL